MNVWKCEKHGCTNTCIGVGSALGLRAIGWYFIPGFNNNLFCPVHRPDPIDCKESENTEPCTECAAEKEAKDIQEMIEAQDDILKNQ